MAIGGSVRWAAMRTRAMRGWSARRIDVSPVISSVAARALSNRRTLRGDLDPQIAVHAVQERGFDFFAVARESEVICRVFETVEVQFEQWIAAVPEQGFDERKARRRCVGAGGAGEKLGFEQALAELLGRVGVDDDAAAYAHVAAARLRVRGCGWLR